MKALVLNRYSHLDYQEFPTPVPGPDDVLVRVRACGVCGSDVHGWDGSTGRRQPPLVMGHEAAGEIAATGAHVTSWREGDRVTFDSTIFCGACAYCRSGRVNLCAQRRVLGVAPGDYRQHGAFAEFVAIPERVLHQLPMALGFERAAMAEPVAVALHAVARVAVSSGSVAVVIGAGMIGLLLVQGLRAAGCETVVAVDIDDTRLALARQLGARATVRSDRNDATEMIATLTGGEGADVAFEAVGQSPTVDLAVRCLRRGGAAVLVGNVSPSCDLPLQSVVSREISLVGSCASAGEYPRSLTLLAQGGIRVDPLISAVAPLAEGQQWFTRLSTPGHGLMKVILTP